jgi:pimeloyl-ACP methyl ester carboxylesterase
LVNRADAGGQPRDLASRIDVPNPGALTGGATMTLDKTTGSRVPQAMPDPTTKVRVSDQDVLDVWVTGEGAPVVFIHGAMTRDLLKPVADELATRGGYQVIHYGRRGHGGHGLPGEAAAIPGQAPDVVAILDALGLDKAHVAGHSFGAYIALELALQAPHRLLSTILLETMLAQALTEASQEDMRKFAEVALPLIVENYTSGAADSAVTTFWDVKSGVEDASELIEPALPKGARRLAAADLNTFLQVDGPAMFSWMVDPAAVKQTTTPIAWVGGADSPPAASDSRAQILEWLPRTRAVDIAGAGHYFPVLKPAETATAPGRVVDQPARGPVGATGSRIPSAGAAVST